MGKRKYGSIDGIWQISDEDKALFEKIAKESRSENEKHFFRIVEYREKHNQSSIGDILLDCMKNPDGIGFMRYEYDMYMLLIDSGEGYAEEPLTVETIDLFLNEDFSEYWDGRTNCRTMLEYLRSIDYSVIDYEKDRD